jgi:hypothetical protein
MFAKTNFVRKSVYILYLHTQEMGQNSSRVRPESVAPEFLSWRRTEVKISPPKVGENWSLPIASFYHMFVRAKWGNVRTSRSLWPDWLEFDGSKGAESIQDVLVSHRWPRFDIKVLIFWSADRYRFCSFGFVVPSQIARKFGKSEPKAPISWDKYFNTSASKYTCESTNSGWVIWTTFQALKIYCTWRTWCKRRFWNIHFLHFGENDKILWGRKIGSFDPVIKNSSATDSRWPQIYIFTHSNATYPFRKVCSERTLLVYGQTNIRY